jgi:hypothetical protein
MRIQQALLKLRNPFIIRRAQIPALEQAQKSDQILVRSEHTQYTSQENNPQQDLKKTNSTDPNLLATTTLTLSREP